MHEIKKPEKKDTVLFSPQIEVFTPFAGYVDASRLNMAAKQQLQTVISRNTDTPLVIDKHYKKMTQVDSPFAKFAPEDGHIIFSDNETMLIYYPEMKKLITESVPPTKKLINNSLSIKFKAEVGPVKKGDLLYDYTNMDPKTFMPKIGYRANILFSSFFGYTADDAIVISESFSNKAEIEYTQKIFVPITKEWKYLRNHMDNYFYKDGEIQAEEAYSKYFHMDMGDHFMSEIYNISEQQSMFFTKNLPGIKDGEIVSTKVHRNTDKTFLELKDEYLYTPGMIQEIEEIYKKNHRTYLGVKQVLEQLGIPLEEAQKLSEELYESYYSTKKFPKHFENKLKEEFDLDPKNVDFLLEVTVRRKTKTTRGDKFTNLFAGKGTVSMIIPDELMPKDPDTGKPVDIIFNPLGIFGRNNWGSIFELALSKIIRDVERTAKAVLEDAGQNPSISGLLTQKLEFIDKHFISKYDPDYSKDIKEMIVALNSSLIHENPDPILNLASDIVEKNFYLYAPNFMELPYREFFTDFIEPYSKKFDINVDKSNITYSKDLMGWLRDNWHYKNDIIGDEVYEVNAKAFVGENYILKLYHTSYSKFTAVSLANSYSKITGQPVRGRKKTGGQHISWQTLAALLGHKENNAMLKELYTIKSDAPVKDKEKFLMEYITHGRYRLKPKYVSLTKRAVNNALKILGMQLEE